MILPPPCEIMPGESHTSRNMLINCMELGSSNAHSSFDQLTSQYQTVLLLERQKGRAEEPFQPLLLDKLQCLRLITCNM